MSIELGLLAALGLYSFAAGFYAMRLADVKGYGTFGWFLGGLFFNVIALIAIAGLPVKK